MDFPLLKTFEVESWLVESLLEFLEELKIKLPNWEYKTAFSDVPDSYETDNLVDRDYPQLDIFSKYFISKASDLLHVPEKNIELFWFHFLDYGKGGEMGIHNHMHLEDFVMFIYLSTCDDGQTTWYLNNFDGESQKRTTISCVPERGKGALFSSLVDHYGTPNAAGTKKLCVLGLRVRLDNI